MASGWVEVLLRCVIQCLHCCSHTARDQLHAVWQTFNAVVNEIIDDWIGSVLLRSITYPCDLRFDKHFMLIGNYEIFYAARLVPYKLCLSKGRITCHICVVRVLPFSCDTSRFSCHVWQVESWSANVTGMTLKNRKPFELKDGVSIRLISKLVHMFQAAKSASFCWRLSGSKDVIVTLVTTVFFEVETQTCINI